MAHTVSDQDAHFAGDMESLHVFMWAISQFWLSISMLNRNLRNVASLCLTITVVDFYFPVYLILDMFRLPLVVGSMREVTLQVTVRNSGDPAFLTRVEVALPAPLDVARMPAPCYAPGGVEHLLHCNLGASHGRGHEVRSSDGG